MWSTCKFKLLQQVLSQSISFISPLTAFFSKPRIALSLLGTWKGQSCDEIILLPAIAAIHKRYIISLTKMMPRVYTDIYIFWHNFWLLPWHILCCVVWLVVCHIFSHIYKHILWKPCLPATYSDIFTDMYVTCILRYFPFMYSDICSGKFRVKMLWHVKKMRRDLPWYISCYIMTYCFQFFQDYYIRGVLACVLTYVLNHFDISSDTCPGMVQAPRT